MTIADLILGRKCCGMHLMPMAAAKLVLLSLASSHFSIDMTLGVSSASVIVESQSKNASVSVSPTDQIFHSPGSFDPRLFDIGRKQKQIWLTGLDSKSIDFGSRLLLREGEQRVPKVGETKNSSLHFKSVHA